MSYRSIVVHLDTSARAQARLHVAIELAQQHGALLRGVFCVYTPDPRSFYVMAGTAEYYAEHDKTRHQACGALERLFHAEAARAKIDAQWIVEDGNAADEIPRHARRADLVVIGQNDPTDPEAFVAEHFAENVVMSSGRPVLLIPYAGSYTRIGRRIMIAWDGSREATRALHDALPLITRAEQVVIVTIGAPHGATPDAPAPGAEVAALLGRHGVRASTLDLDKTHDVTTGELLLSRIEDLVVDLVVMGGYGHTRWQEVILGGVTRTMLSSMTAPVLMSH